MLAGCLTQNSISLSILLKRPTAVFFLLIGFVGAFSFYFKSNLTLPHVIIACCLTFIYSLPLLPFKQLAFARKAGFLKTILLAFTWTYVTAWLPMSEQNVQLTTFGALIIAKRFLFMLMLCILFDNRDIAVDKIRGLHSLATDLSEQTMQYLIYAVFAALFILNFFLGKHGLNGKQVAALQLSAIINLVVYYFSTKKQGYLFYYFIVDGMMVLMTLLTTVASI